MRLLPDSGLLQTLTRQQWDIVWERFEQLHEERCRERCSDRCSPSCRHHSWAWQKRVIERLVQEIADEPPDATSEQPHP